MKPLLTSASTTAVSTCLRLVALIASLVAGACAPLPGAPSIGADSDGADAASSTDAGPVADAAAAQPVDVDASTHPDGASAQALDSGSPGVDAGPIDDAGSAAQPPIFITFDLHCDPLPQVLPQEERRQFFRRQIANAQWLLDEVEPHGARISFLAVGECYEFCVEDSERDTCLPLLQRLYQSGGILGTHQHCQYRAGPHDWPDIDNCYREPAADDVRRVWNDSRRFTEAAIAAALSLTDPSAIARVNASCGSHAQLADSSQMMEELGYSILEGGGDQDLVPFFNHVPWNPYRPGATTIIEDPATAFVTVPQGMVLGHVGEHKGIEQDGRPARKKAELLELYATWQQRERSGAAPRVWTFGWGVHTQDLEPGSESRAAVQELIPWLAQHVVNSSSPTGAEVARFASYVEARDAYLAWEAANPDTSSFSYPLTVRDYASYPYLEWANRYLYAASVEAETAPAAGVRLYRMVSGDDALLLALTDQAAIVDASELGPRVRSVDLETGAAVEVAASAVAIAAGSHVLCAPAACDAILALTAATSQGTACQPACAAGQTVCCPEGLPCAGQCVQDCRAQGSTCPPQVPQCNASSGLCEPASSTAVREQQLTVRNPTSGVDWWAKALYPAAASAATPYPAVILVPGGSGAGSAMEAISEPSRNPALAAERGFVVVLFDADGRGNTAGSEDDAGHVQQDGLGALIEAVAALPYVDQSRIGLSTSSYGITMGSGVLARYPGLPVRFLLDVEGPADRTDTGHCDASNTGHLEHDCADDAWWSEREAASFLRQVAVPYLRLQHVRDHAQPDNLHCIKMINAATSAQRGGQGLSSWTRVNRAADNPPNQVFSEAAPPSYIEDTTTLDLPAFWTELLAL